MRRSLDHRGHRGFSGRALIVWGVCCFFSIAFDADASGRRAGLVVDVESGRVLHADHADSPRYPASLTKIMTLYLLFEDLEAGKIALSEQMPVSARAAHQAPSKLGLRPGAALSVDEAIRALVTKSANDAAVVVAERLAGSEEAFAQRMTEKARALGMSRTTFRNASGLPHPQQMTTARDLALLSMAIQKHFPARYGIFSLRVFRHAGRMHVNHNRLLGRVVGVDGIKTGYTRASGFNLAASIQRDGRHLVAVVLGHQSGPMRDAYMIALIEAALSEGRPPVLSARVETPAPPPRIAAAAPAPAPVRTAPVRAAPVRTASVRPAPVRPAILRRPHRADDRPRVAAAPVRPPAAAPRAAAATVGRWIIQVGALPTEAEAATLLDLARSKGGTHLSYAAPMTEKVEKDGQTLYRARFAGLDEAAAQAACKALRERALACFAARA